MRESTAAAKAMSDNAEISLQNLLYEKGYYLKEIRACQSFRWDPRAKHFLRLQPKKHSCAALDHFNRTPDARVVPHKHAASIICTAKSGLSP